MEKIAEVVKQAEVNGVVAALCDAGYVNIQDEVTFGKVAEQIAVGLKEDYQLEDVLAKTAEVLDSLDGAGEEALEKEAGDIDETAAMATYGNLVLLKEAGEIDDAEFEKEAGKVKAVIEAAGKAVKGAPKAATEAANYGKMAIKDLAKGYKQSAKGNLRMGADKAKDAARGAVIAGGAVAGAGMGAKAMYDKYKK